MEASGAGVITTSGTNQRIIGPRFGKRLEFTITNYGATLAWVNPSDAQTAAVARGIPLYPGATMSGEKKGDNSKCYQGQICAVDDGSSGATVLAYWERCEE